MPNIKSPYGVRNGVRVFDHDGTCWKCGKAIKVGTLNWSYNTQVAGKYSHQDCVKAETEPNAPETQQPPQVKPDLKPKASETPTANEQAQYNAASAQEKLMLDALDKMKVEQAKAKAEAEAKAKPNVPVWNRPPVPKYHKYYDLMKRALTNAPKKSVYLAGAPGSSKTFSIMQYALDTELPYYCVPLSETTTASDIFGYISPISKELIRTMFRDWYENGGILDLPETDNTDPNVLTMINNAIDNGICGFPDGMIKRHANAYLIANGNTDMRGPTSQFDAATLERFIFIQWDYDTQFEQAFYAEKQLHMQYIELVHKIRKAARESETEIVVSQRAIRDGIAMLDAGFNFDQAMSLTLFKQHPQTEDLYLAIGRAFIPQDILWSNGGKN